MNATIRAIREIDKEDDLGADLERAIGMSGKVLQFTSPKIKRTPPEGDSDFALCTRGGKPDGEVLCLYIPNWGA